MRKRILTVADLKKSYITKGNTYPVQQGVDMEVQHGEFIAVMGPFSSGKIFDNYQEAAIQDKTKGYQDTLIPYAGNELYTARQWDFYPYAKLKNFTE